MSSFGRAAPLKGHEAHFEHQLDLLDEACRVAAHKARQQLPHGTTDEIKVRAWELLTGERSFRHTP